MDRFTTSAKTNCTQNLWLLAIVILYTNLDRTSTLCYFVDQIDEVVRHLLRLSSNQVAVLDYQPIRNFHFID